MIVFENCKVVEYLRMMLYFIGYPKWCHHSKGLSLQLHSVCSLLDSWHVCIYTFQLCFLDFLKAVHFMLVGLLSSDSYQSIFLLWAFFFFLIYSIQYETHLFTAKSLNCQVSVHKCTDKCKFAKNCYICHHFEYQTDPL